MSKTTVRKVRQYCPGIQKIVSLTIKGIVRGLLIEGEIFECSEHNCKRPRHCLLGQHILVRLD